MSRSKKKYLGCIDMGSSYFRLLVTRETAESECRGIETVLEDARYIGWGTDLQGDGKISPESMDRAAAVLEELIAVSREAGCPEPCLAGTNTFRGAVNSAEAVHRLEDRVSIPVKVLSETGEAATGFIGATSIIPSGERAIVIDVGGTSTEVSWGKRGDFRGHAEIRAGTHLMASIAGVRLRNKPFRMIKRDFLRVAFKRWPGKGGPFQSLSCLPSEYENSNIIATGGTAVSAAAILGFAKRKRYSLEDMKFDREELGLVIRRSGGSIETGMSRSLPVPRERAVLLMPGLAILDTVFDIIGVSSFRVTARDLRWGVIFLEGAIPGRYLVDER